jgi:8-oxo-dGTP pyrophosphatase MutT (NUDIX family)
MSFAERSRRAVDERIDRLREKYGSFPVETRTVENDPAYFDDGVEYFEAGHRGAAGALVRDEVGRVLLIEHPDGPVWETSGGGHDPGRRYEETALREVREETTVECEITGVFRVERKRYVDATDPERRGYTHVHDADERRVYVLDDPAHETTTEGIVVRRHVRGHLDDTQPVERGEFAAYRRFVRDARGRWQEWRVIDLAPVARAVDGATGGC